MSFRRVVMTLILAAAAVLAGCGEEDVVPEELLAPALPEVRVEADGCVVTLTARFRNEADLASVKEFGFYFGRDEVSMDCLKVTKVVGLEYSLIKEDLDYSTTYLFKVWVGNGREEKASELKEVTTGEKPVGPDPPVPAVRNIAFKDPVVEAVCVRNWDLDGDGELSMAEAAQVTDLGMVFKRNEEITSFEELEYFTGLGSVADSAFKCCVRLRFVKLPESVRDIGDHAFKECGEVNLPKLPDNLTTLGGSAFCLCTKLSLTSLPETLTSIGNWAFDNCTNLALTTLPSGLTSIGDGTFNRCFNIVPEELPSGLTKVGSWAFSECSSFNPKLLPEGVETIGQNAFGGCSSLTWTQLPSSLREMGNWAFAQCWKVGFSSIPDGVVKISKATFEGCSSMKGLSLPESVRVIDSLAFNGLPLKEVTIPENVTFIGGDAFKGSDHRMTVWLLPKTPPVMEDTCLGDNAGVIYVHAGSFKKYRTSKNWNRWKDKYDVLPGEEIPQDAIDIAFKDPVVEEVCVRNWDLDGDGELSMAEAAQVTDLGMVFKRNEEITSFEELEHFTGLVEVADSAFGHCTNLRDIKLPESVRVIGQRAFEECGNMLLRKLPDNLATVKTHAFAGCGKMPLTSLPETLTLIENWAFARCGSMRLTSLPSALTLIDSGVFSECYGVAPEKLPENLCYIGEWAFFNARPFNPKELPSGVREIGKYAFQGCESLTWTQLPSDLYEIGDYAFFYCWKVRFSSLPKRMIRVNAGVFENCVSITSLTLPEGLTSIGPNAFKNCKFFEITIPESVVFIGAEAFNGCSRLRSVTVLPPVPPEMEDTYIGDNANVMYVPSSSMEAYRIARNWSEWKSKYRTLDDL